MEYLEFYLVEQHSKFDFEREVTGMCKAGWHCQGGVQVQWNAHDSIIAYFQGMVRKKLDNF